MQQVFISYSHAEPDASRAQSLAEALARKNVAVVYDRLLPLGMQWASMLENWIKSSNYFVVLLSLDAIQSDFVIGEVRMAHRFQKSAPGKPRILPVRDDSLESLPLEWSTYLEPIQHAQWAQSDTPAAVADRLLGAIDESAPLKPAPARHDPQALYDATEARGLPLPSAEPELETGTLRLDSPFYIRRDADLHAERQIGKAGTTTIVKAPRQFGKSSLLARMHAAARMQKRKSLYVDFQLIDESQMETLESLFRYLAQRVFRGFGLARRPDECWDSHLGSKDNLTCFLEDVALGSTDDSLQLIFDEADRVFERSYRNDFFATIRGWHNMRATNECWQRLNIVIGHSTSPALWIQDLNQSPFNVGLALRLDDLDVAQLSALADTYGARLSGGEIEDLRSLVGGHPYLARLSLHTLVTRGWTWTQIKDAALDPRGPFSEHLRGLFWQFGNDHQLGLSLREVMLRNRCQEERQFQRLLAAGLVHGPHRNEVTIRCRLYHDYLAQHL